MGSVELRSAELCAKIRELDAILQAAESNADENYFQFVSTLPYFGKNQFQTKLENEIIESDESTKEIISNCGLVNEYVYQKKEIMNLSKQVKDLEQANLLLEAKLEQK